MPAEYTTPSWLHENRDGAFYCLSTKLQAISYTGKIFTKRLARIQYLEADDHMTANSQLSERIATKLLISLIISVLYPKKHLF